MQIFTSVIEKDAFPIKIIRNVISIDVRLVIAFILYHFFDDLQHISNIVHSKQHKVYANLIDYYQRYQIHLTVYPYFSESQ